MTNEAHSRKTVEFIKNSKNSDKPLVCLTAYSTPMAKLLDPHCDLLLVGDSLGMALYGMDDTLGVTLDMMINHAKAVMRGARNACVMVDMPYGTYETSPTQALKNARQIMDQTGCDALKLEGGADMVDTINLLTNEGIPVMAHIGLKPQSVKKEGGYRVKGKTEEDIKSLLNDAKAVEQAGAFAILVEGTIEPVAAKITQSVEIPTIGIGASVTCDGQILVTEDMLGLITEHRPKFAKLYVDLASHIDSAAAQYADEVRNKTFPSAEYTYQTKVKR